jgi:hypothetical protein
MPYSPFCAQSFGSHQFGLDAISKGYQKDAWLHGSSFIGFRHR